MRAEFTSPAFGGSVPAATSPGYDADLFEPSARPTLGWTRRHWALAVSATLAIWAVAASAWPLSGSVVPWDSKNHFYPMLRYLGDSLAAGEWPLWNPYHFSGHPAVADPQSLLFNPTMLLFGWLVPAPSMQLFDLVIFAHFLPGMLAMLALFARRDWRPEGAVVAAIVFVLGGSASARLQHTGIIFGYGYFPLTLLLLEEMLARRSYRFAAGFAVMASLMVSGRDQVAFLMGLTLLGAVVHEAFVSGRPVRFLRERLGVLALAGAIGTALLAVPVLLTLQFLGTSTRPAFGFGVAAMGSLPPESFATFLFANVFGSLRATYDYWGPDWHSLLEGTWTDRATNYLFAGSVPAVLIVWHGIGAGRLLAREFRYFLIVGLVTIVYALGRYTPLFSVVFDSLPGVALYRRPADATFVINIVIAFAAGYLVHRYLRDGNPRLARLQRSPLGAMLAAGATALVVAAIVSALIFAVRAKQAAAAGSEILIAAGIAAAIVGLLVSGSRHRRVAVAALLTAFTGGELIWRNAASALNAEPAERYAVFRELPADQMRGLAVLKDELAQRHARGEHPRVEILGLGGAWQNASMVLGLEDTIGYNPLRLADYERAIGPGENAVDPNLRQFPGTFRGYRCRLASLLGLEYLVLDRPVERLPRHFPRLTGTKLLYGAGGMWIYKLDRGAPRAYLATQILPVDSDAVLTQAEIPDFDRTTTALVEQEDLGAIRGDYVAHENAPEQAARGIGGSVVVTAYGRNAVSLEVNTKSAGIVVLHDINYPGWEASVDGQHQHIVRTNLLFRGVEVEPGHHVIEFHFRPLSVGNIVSAAADVLHGSGEESGPTVTR